MEQSAGATDGTQGAAPNGAGNGHEPGLKGSSSDGAGGGAWRLKSLRMWVGSSVFNAWLVAAAGQARLQLQYCR